MKTFEQFYLDTIENKLYTYENAVEKEIDYQREGYDFYDWLSEDYNVTDLYNLFKEDGDVDRTISELKRKYEIVIRKVAEDEINRADKDFGDWRVYGVEK